jgi:putative transposase
LVGDIQKRCRAILIQVCDAEGVNILKGVVSKDHIHMHIEYRPSQSVSNLVKKLKGRSSRKLQQEFPALHKKYLGSPFFGYWIWLLEYRKYHR